MLSAALSLEQLSGHPLSAATAPPVPTGVWSGGRRDFRSVTGKGLSCRRGGLLPPGLERRIPGGRRGRLPLRRGHTRPVRRRQTPVAVAEGAVLGLLAVADSLNRRRRRRWRP